MPNIPQKTRRLVFERAKGCCEYCWSQSKYSTNSFAIEHIIPTSKGGNDNPSNLALACHGCYGAKSIKTEGFDPATEKIFPLYNPREQDWNQHFRWSSDYLSIVGLTGSGRATLHELKMNRSGLQNQRQAIVALGDHPPEGTT